MQEYKDANEIWELVQCSKTRLLEDPKIQEEDNKGKIVIKVSLFNLKVHFDFRSIFVHPSKLLLSL